MVFGQSAQLRLLARIGIIVKGANSKIVGGAAQRVVQLRGLPDNPAPGVGKGRTLVLHYLPELQVIGELFLAGIHDGQVLAALELHAHLLGRLDVLDFYALRRR